MKIKKLEKKNGRYDLAEVPDKINEIIELLNNSFITNDPGTVYGEVTDSLTTISCDRLTPFTNETTCELSVDHLMNMVEGAGGIYNNINLLEENVRSNILNKAVLVFNPVFFLCFIFGCTGSSLLQAGFLYL